MKWFNNWFAKKCLHVLRGADNNEREIGEIAWARKYSNKKISSIGGIGIQHNESVFSSSPMRFNIYCASGGWVLECTYYSESKDENINSLHVINNDDDLGKAISQIITFEILRK